MGPRVIIHEPADNAMQSGKRRGRWLVDFEPSEPKVISPLMAWPGSGDARRQLRLYFTTLRQAEDYARKNGLDYEIRTQEGAECEAKCYADNFCRRRY